MYIIMERNMEHPHARPMEPLEFGVKAVLFDDYADVPLHFATQVKIGAGESSIAWYELVDYWGEENRLGLKGAAKFIKSKVQVLDDGNWVLSEHAALFGTIRGATTERPEGTYAQRHTLMSVAALAVGECGATAGKLERCRLYYAIQEWSKK